MSAKKVKNDELSFKDLCQIEIINKNKKRIKRFYLAVIVWLLLVAYFFTPFSQSHIISLKGNVYLTKDDIYEISNIDTSKYIWETDLIKVRASLNQHRFIYNPRVGSIPFGIYITFEEVVVVSNTGDYCDAKVSTKCDYYLSDGTTLYGEDVASISEREHIIMAGNVPTFVNIEKLETKEMKTILDILGDVDKNVIKLINTVEKNNTFTNFDVYKFTFKSEKLLTKYPLELNFDVNDIKENLTKKKLNSLISQINKLNPEVDGVYRYVYSDNEFLPY